MPPISAFFGIVISMYWREHEPPHFHAAYGEVEALVSIQTLEVLLGVLSRRALALVLEWANDHRAELPENWQLCRGKGLPEPIPPLE